MASNFISYWCHCVTDYITCCITFYFQRNVTHCVTGVRTRMVDISVFVQNTLEVISVRNQSDVRIEIPVKMVLLVTVCPEAVLLTEIIAGSLAYLPVWNLWKLCRLFCCACSSIGTTYLMITWYIVYCCRHPIRRPHLYLWIWFLWWPLPAL